MSNHEHLAQQDPDDLMRGGMACLMAAMDAAFDPHEVESMWPDTLGESPLHATSKQVLLLQVVNLAAAAITATCPQLQSR